MTPLEHAQQHLRIEAGKFSPVNEQPAYLLIPSEVAGLRRDLHELLAALDMRGADQPGRGDRDLSAMRVAVHLEDGSRWLTWRIDRATGEWLAVPMTGEGIRYITGPEFPAKQRRAATEDRKKRLLMYSALTAHEQVLAHLLADTPEAERPAVEVIARRVLALASRDLSTPSENILAMLDPARAPDRARLQQIHNARRAKESTHA